MPADSATTAEKLSEWQTVLKEAGCRVTLPRRTILSTILAMPGPFNADELLIRAREEDESIALATVYRTIKLLEESDLLRPVQGVGDKQLYEVGSAVETQAYLVCDECGKTLPIGQEGGLLLRERFMLKQMGYSVRQINLRVRVVCDAHAE